MKRRPPALWLIMSLGILIIFLATSTVTLLIAALLFNLGVLTAESPIIPLAALLVTCVVAGTLFTTIVGRRLLGPITDLSRAAQRVSRGDFTVELEEWGRRPAELREMANNFNTMVRELGSIETLREDFVVSVSHEFKTPLATIEGYATLLQDESLTPVERREYTGTIISSARQLSDLVGNILRLSKLENQEMVADKQAVRLDEQIREAILVLEPQWSAKDLELDLDLCKISYHGSPELLHQVWHNLLDNAVKFTPPGGKITVRMALDEDTLAISVEDTGPGISDEDLRHIFDKFYQGDTSRKADGNGLGLALVRRITELCGGGVEAESRPGGGSVFTVRLPVE